MGEIAARRVDLDAAEAVQKYPDRYLPLEPCQWCAQTPMGSVPEGEVVLRDVGPIDVEGIG